MKDKRELQGEVQEDLASPLFACFVSFVVKKMFSFSDPKDCDRLRELLQKMCYTDSGILEVLRVKDLPSIAATDIPLLLSRTGGGSPLETLIRLFLIEVPVDLELVEKAVQPMSARSLVEAGLLHVEGNEAEAAVKLLPYQGLMLAFDLPGRLQTESRQDYVMGIGRSTITLANLTIRRHARAALDLGTGCGIQTCLAAPHSDRVIAVDRNPRAVRLAQFNAKLNGLDNVQCLEGNLFEPVQEKTFDLVVTNPPFVISPESSYIYRDSGMGGDRISRTIAHEAPNFLNEGGFCQILCNWVEKADRDWREGLRTWFEGTGCDVWIMRSETRDAETYASTWIRHTEKNEPEDYPQRFREWLAYYEKEGIDSVGAGLITMRKATDRNNWYRADDAPERMLGPCGESILQGFELRDFLENAYDDAALLEHTLRISPDVRLERQSVPSKEGWVDNAYGIRLAKGLAYSGGVDPYMANLMAGCNGEHRLRDLFADMVRSLKTDPVKTAPQFCNIVRGLIERGFLLPPVVSE